MRILGIETSADETSVSIVENGTKILSNVVSSSMELHDRTGGIIPEIAAREQVKLILPVLDASLQDAHVSSVSQIDAIAVTIGPGLIGSLLVGVETAKTLSYLYDKPLIPINHIFAHIYANWLNKDKEPEFPALALVVSGGHTELFLLTSHTEWKWIGGTVDDAAGEAFDKTSRLMGFGYPGGPIIASHAKEWNHLKENNHIHLPRPMIGSKDLNFSFSGLKTAVMREVKKLQDADQFNTRAVQELSYELQETITDVLVKKTIAASKEHSVYSVLLGGGVSANQRLKEKLTKAFQETSVRVFIPEPKLCTDNGASIACMAYYHNTPVSWRDVQARPDFEVEV